MPRGDATGLRRGFGSVLTVVDLARRDVDATALGVLEVLSDGSGLLSKGARWS